jgi:hypothetical protein
MFPEAMFTRHHLSYRDEKRGKELDKFCGK